MPGSNFQEKTTGELWLVGKNATAPTVCFLALTEVSPTKTQKSKEIEAAEAGKELNYTGYKRTELKLEAGKWKATAGSGEATPTTYVNEAAISIPLNTVTGTQQKAKYIALCEKKIGEQGEIFFFAKLTAELEITTAITKLEFEAGKLELVFE